MTDTPLTAASLANIKLEIEARDAQRPDDELMLRMIATIATLTERAERAEREVIRLTDTGVRADPLLRQAVADVDATIEALQAEVTTLRTALEEVAGLLNEMHLPLQGHRASQCTLRTDFCVTAEHVQAALAECIAQALEATAGPRTSGPQVGKTLWEAQSE